jgi:hypothetical protein
MNNESILSQCGEGQRIKIKEMLNKGYIIYDYDYWEVKMVKGYSYCVITRGNTFYWE